LFPAEIIATVKWKVLNVKGGGIHSYHCALKGKWNGIQNTKTHKAQMIGIGYQQNGHKVCTSHATNITTICDHAETMSLTIALICKLSVYNC
jgi:hypothetical protein